MEITVEHLPDEFVIKADTVEAHHAGISLAELAHDQGGKVPFDQAMVSDIAHPYPCHEQRIRRWHDIIARPAQEVQGITDLVQRLVSSNPCELQWPVANRIDTGGFQVVPEKRLYRSGQRHHSLEGG